MVAEFTLGIGTNLVTDLIKYGGKRFLDTTVIGTKLKEKVGLLDTTTEDEFKKLLLETYVAYFSKYPDRQFQVFYDFFDSKHVIECLYNFVFNFQPIDYLKLENALKTEMGNDWILMRILEKQNLTIRDMIINFIDCYLKSEKDSTGIGFLTAIREIRQSEERILNKTSSQLDNASQKIIESVLDSFTNHIEKLQVELHKLGVTEKDAPSLGGLEKDAQAIQAAIHELQSPLTGIMAHTENIARESKKDKPNFERIDKQLEAVLSLCHMLSYTFLNVLGYSSVAGYRFGKANIAEILNRIVSVYKPMAKSNNNIIVVELRDDTVLEVSWALELAINNIVNNAVRFSFPKGFEKQNNIRVFGKREGQFYKLSVMNFGIPILPDEYDKVFENGYRSRLAKDVSPSGIGRGLFVAKAIIEQHNGKIYVSSKQEKEGYLTTFLVYLPYSQPSSEK